MTYRENTPQILSILTRKLKPGKTFEDFQKAHLPPGNVTMTEFGYDVDYFKAPIRVINTVSATDPSIIVSVGLTYGDPKEVVQELASKIALEKGRHDQVDEVADKVGPSMVYFVASGNNYGGANPEYHQLPLFEAMPEIEIALEALAP